jgi:Rrf2 family protein
MASVLRISEATSLALHTTALLAAQRGRRLSTKEIAQRLGVSEAHLAKVLQRLGKAGLVRSVRGRNGGFTLARARERIKLLQVYQAMEGPLRASKCLMAKRVCQGEGCVLGGLLEMVDVWVRAYLGGTNLAQLSDVYGGEDADAQEDNQD